MRTRLLMTFILLNCRQSSASSNTGKVVVNKTSSLSIMIKKSSLSLYHDINLFT